MTILRACAVCAKPTPEPYCEAHRPKAWQGSRRRELMGLSGSAWDRLRRQILQRDKGTCYLCGKLGATEVDHLRELAAGGTNDPSNLASAHPSCHRRKHRDPEWARERVAHVLALLGTGGRPRSHFHQGSAKGAARAPAVQNRSDI